MKRAYKDALILDKRTNITNFPILTDIKLLIITALGFQWLCEVAIAAMMSLNYLCNVYF